MLRRALILTIVSCCALAAGCVGVVVAAVASMTGSRPATSAPVLPSTAGISKPPRPAFAIPDTTPLDGSEITARWASLTRTTAIYRAPSPHARPLGRVGGVTPEGTVNVVLVKGYAQDEAGQTWVDRKSVV